MDSGDRGLPTKVLKSVAPGTPLRSAIDRILQAGSGTLIVIGDENEMSPIMNGGFEIHCEFSAPRLSELSKMDGAVVVSKDKKTITHANVHLVPAPEIPTSESGMRHRTAERVAKETDSLVIAVSEKLKTVTVYVDNINCKLDDIPVVLAKADQGLKTLVRYRLRLDEEISRLNALELEDCVTLRDVVSALQSFQMVVRMFGELETQVSELGKEGRMVRLQLDELMIGITDDALLVIKDYNRARDRRQPEKAWEKLGRLAAEELLDARRVAEVLSYRGDGDKLGKEIKPRGYRVLSMVPRIPGPVIDKVVRKFGNLQKIMRASVADLDAVDGVGKIRAGEIKEGLERVFESSMLDSLI